MADKHGFTAQQLSLMHSILSKFAEKILRVDVFGSRANGTFRPNSDADLVIYGCLDAQSIDRLWTLFHESPLPFSVDVKSYELISYAPLRAHIDKVSSTLFTQQDLISTQESHTPLQNNLAAKSIQTETPIPLITKTKNRITQGARKEPNTARSAGKKGKSWA